MRAAMKVEMLVSLMAGKLDYQMVVLKVVKLVDLSVSGLVVMLVGDLVVTMAVWLVVETAELRAGWKVAMKDESWADSRVSSLVL